MISLPRLKLLLALHERGTLQAAAIALHISTSAASQQLATLSREVGAVLTEADGRKLRLTEAGRVMVDHAYAVFAQLEQAQGDVQAAVDGQLGHITLGGFPSAIPTLLIPAATSLQQTHPRLRIDLREAEVPASLDLLATGGLDLVVAILSETRSAPDPRYEPLPLGIDDFLLAVPSGHPLSRQPSADIGQLAGEDWVSTLPGDACDQLLHNACLSAGFRPAVRHRASDWLAILALVENRLGLALIPSSAPLPLPSGVTVLPVNEPISRHVYAVVRRGAATHRAVDACLTALRAVAGRTLRPSSDSGH